MNYICNRKYATDSHMNMANEELNFHFLPTISVLWQPRDEGEGEAYPDVWNLCFLPRLSTFWRLRDGVIHGEFDTEKEAIMLIFAIGRWLSHSARFQHSFASLIVERSCQMKRQ